MNELLSILCLREETRLSVLGICSQRKTVVWTHYFLHLHLLEVKGKSSRDPYSHFMDEAIASHDVGVLPPIFGLVSGNDRKGPHP